MAESNDCLSDDMLDSLLFMAGYFRGLRIVLCFRFSDKAYMMRTVGQVWCLGGWRIFCLFG
jgi:hypothetical protein